MRPSTGEVFPSAAELRERVVLVDSPGVSEPEPSLSLAGVVGEELAVNGARSGRKAVADRLAERDADRYLDHRFEQVPADVRCALALELAAGRPGAAALVLDSPDRYHGDPAGWWELARRHVTPDRSVVVLCTTTSATVYAVDGLRHLMYGGPLGNVGRDALVLVGYLVAGLALATLAAYKQRVWTPSRLKPELVL